MSLQRREAQEPTKVPLFLPHVVWYGTWNCSRERRNFILFVQLHFFEKKGCPLGFNPGLDDEIASFVIMLLENITPAQWNSDGFTITVLSYPMELVGLVGPLIGLESFGSWRSVPTQPPASGRAPRRHSHKAKLVPAPRTFVRQIVEFSF